MTEPLLEVKGLTCMRSGDGGPIFSNLNFSVYERDILVLQGQSGVGKTTLLKCLAHLNVYNGDIFFEGRTPISWGIPYYRTRVLYVPQRPSLLPGTPRDFLTTVCAFKSRKINRPDASPLYPEQPFAIAKAWGIEEEQWDRSWSTLSGGEGQRIALAVAVGLNPEILLLDEPTSALDSGTSSLVEKYLVREISLQESSLKAIVWITHSDEQRRSIGTRFMHVTAGGCREEPLTPAEV